MIQSPPITDHPDRCCAAGGLRRWRERKQAEVQRGSLVCLGRIELPAGDAAEVIDAAYESLARDLVSGRLDGLGQRDLEIRATVRSQARAIDLLRSQGRRPVVVSLDRLTEDEPTDGVCRLLGREEPGYNIAERESFRAAMLNLPPSDRRLLSMTAWGFEDEEISAALNISETSVRKRRQRARARLVSAEVLVS